MILLATGLSLGFVARLKPVGPGPWLFFSIWLLLPYGVMALSLWRKQRRQQVATPQTVIAIIAICTGIFALAYIIVWRPDPQGALAVLMVPPIQIIVWFIMTVVHNKKSSV